MSSSQPATLTPPARLGGPPDRADRVIVGRTVTVVRHSGFLAVRSVRSLLRQPAFAAITLVQPVIWLLLFGQLFRNVVQLPGFTGGGSYLEFLTPGVVVMTALFSSGWAGTVFIEDMDRGVMDRLLASPVRRGAMIVGSLTYQMLTTVVQSLIIFGIALACGARFAGGVAGVVVTVLAACLISVVIASFSNAVALLVRQQEALIGISQFIVLPLQFLSSSIIDTRVAPAWVREVARYNPVDWASTASRAALSAGTDWGVVLPRLGLLLALAALVAWSATRAFRSYQRSL
jgi:ABC-2 type transport system permease protein